MIRKLLIVFASGLALSILLISAAWVIGGEELVTSARRDYGGWGWDREDRRDGRYRGPMEMRMLTFDGDKLLTIDAPATLRFTRGADTRMAVEGPARIVRNLTWENGRLSLGNRGRWFNGPLEVTITAPQLAGLTLHGASDVELVDLDQPALTIDAYGAVDLDASGKVRRLDVSSHGAGNLDLEDVDAGDATLRVFGVGNIDVSATGRVDAGISGAGNISLHRKPASLTSKVSGIGAIDHEYGPDPD